jgi:aspartate/methionine/tyrosine aminotransferase
VAQRAALAAIEAPPDCIRQMVKTYDKRRHVVYEGLNAIDGVQCLKPQSTFYAFPNISSFGLSSWDFAKYLVKEHRVAIVPGSIFGKAGEGYVRLSFAANAERLKEGIARIRRGVEALKT